MVCMSFSGCWTYGHLLLAPFYVLMAVFILALLATPGRVVTGLFVLLVTIAGSYIGHVNFRANMYQYCLVEGRRTYQNVVPDSDTMEYLDAGKLSFDASSKLNLNMSVGFLFQGTTYCAAPVLSQPSCEDSAEPSKKKNKKEKDEASFLDIPSIPSIPWTLQYSASIPGMASKGFMHQRHHRRPLMLLATSEDPDEDLDKEETASPKEEETASEMGSNGKCEQGPPERVEFWAVGTNCCGARGEFWCNGARDEKARQAVVITPFEGKNKMFTVDESEMAQWFNAIDQAVSIHALPPPDRKVMLHWGADYDKLQNEWRQKAIGILLMSALVSLLLISGIGICARWTQRYRRRQDVMAMQDYEKKMSGNADAPTVYNDSPRPSLPPASGKNSGNLR